MRILVVDDEKNIRDSIIKYLGLENWQADGAETGEAALRMLGERRYDLVLLDLRLPGIDGHGVLKQIRSDDPLLPVIMISAHGEIDDAVKSMQAGAADYLVKPFDPEELILRIRHSAEASRLRRRFEVAEPAEGLVGDSPPMRRVTSLIRKAAPSDATVLITGESGTGKEVAARLLHDLSPRHEGPFVAINVGSLPESLIESELFGHEQGAFTGAEKRRLGIFESAAGGTLLLDEIGEMPLKLQVRLLRVLQERKLRRVGGNRDIPTDVRILAATNRRLEEQVSAKEFREDLYYRLKVISVPLPPLRERREDIPLLAAHFLKQFGRRMGHGPFQLENAALEQLCRHDFPGNVRELENILERACILSEGESICAADIDLPERSKSAPTFRGTLREMEERAVENALRRWEGNRTRAAEELGITRRTIINKIAEYGIDA